MSRFVVALALGTLGTFTLLGGGCAARPAVVTSSSSGNPVAEPDGMIRVPAGVLVRGRDDADRPDERPRHRVRVAAFAIDATLVSRADFARFVAARGHETYAEQVGFGMGAKEGMDDWEWQRIPGASWRRPFFAGATNEEAADTASFLRDDAPVVFVDWFDASAYCASLGKRLPTEAEWQWAMAAGAEGTRYPWGEEAEQGGRWRLNFWQGESHRKNTRLDGWVYVSPVRAFPPNAWGIHDPVGNVWQWTSDAYLPDAYARAARGEPPPAGTASSLRVLRGGSWWCGACTCEGNGLHYRGKAAPHAVYNNNGFRCARDVR